MQITTELEPGMHAFVLHEDKVSKVTVTRLKTNTERLYVSGGYELQTTISYEVQDEEAENFIVNEPKIGSTKQVLLAKL